MVLLVLHIVGLAAVVYGAFTQLNKPEKQITSWVVHGATTQLVTGLALVGVLEAGDDAVNHAKIGVKLLVALAVVGLAHARRRRPSVPSVLIWSLLGLEVVNAAVALGW